MDTSSGWFTKTILLIFSLTLAGVVCYITYRTKATVSSKPNQKLLIICDMWEDGIGGTEEVVKQVRTRLSKKGYKVQLLGLDHISNFKVPFIKGTNSAYPWGIGSKLNKVISNFKPDHILIVWHGIMSQIASAYCHSRRIPFTAFYSARMPECIKAMMGIPVFISRFFINQFLSKASRILVPSSSISEELTQEGFKNVIAWPHGIDLKRFGLPTAKEKKLATKLCDLENKEHPFYLFVGRISKEKNIPAFLNVKLPGTKIVVGPEYCGFNLEKLKEKYPDIVFAGPQYGNDLLNYYRCSDIFLFPSKMDSFGLVMLEALAMGLPIVGFNTTGPKDVVPTGCGVSYLANTDKDLRYCALQAWKDLQKGKVLPSQCHTYASQFSWDIAIEDLEKNLIACTNK